LVAETAVKKTILALQKKLGRAEIVWAVPASILFDFATPTMRQEDEGVIASDGSILYFYKKRMLSEVYESMELQGLESVEQVTAGFQDGNVQVLSLTWRNGGKPWGIVTDAQDRLDYIARKLAGSS